MGNTRLVSKGVEFRPTSASILLTLHSLPAGILTQKVHRCVYQSKGATSRETGVGSSRFGSRNLPFTCGASCNRGTDVPLVNRTAD